MVRPGPRNLLTDVDGLRVGNAEDHGVRSGVTVVLADAPAVAAVDVRGGAPGTRETEALDPTCLVDRADAVVLSGGSAFGLDAAGGVMAWLAARGRGFAVGEARVPIVPAAILFDLLNGGHKAWGHEPPYRRLGQDACVAAALDFALGNAGAGLGAMAGSLKGGLGSASAVTSDGLQVGALIAANPVGSPLIGDGPTLWAWSLEQNGEMGGQVPPRASVTMLNAVGRDLPAGGTVIGVVATNATLTRASARRVAIMAQDGIARAVRPSHTPFDGDTLFVLATGRGDPAASPDLVARIGGLAADCVARSIGRAVYLADDLGDQIAYRTRFR
ncbi:MAG: peptidase S58 family protein [Alphaproteobacteria bacterium]|nr:peptidase S58 family protein [Alphaproteobacteria bacterium]